MIKNIVFDIGDVLTHFCWDKFLRNKGFNESEVAKIAKATVKSDAWIEADRGVLPMEEVVNLFIKKDPTMEKEIRLMMADLTGIVEKADYALPWIQDLKQRGYKVYYLSNFSEKGVKECSEALHFVPYMDGGIFSYSEKIVKPDKEIYKRLIERYGLKPEECIFIDDTSKNIDAAIACGWQGIVFTTREEVMEELEKRLCQKPE